MVAGIYPKRLTTWLAHAKLKNPKAPNGKRSLPNWRLDWYTERQPTAFITPCLGSKLRERRRQQCSFCPCYWPGRRGSAGHAAQPVSPGGTDLEAAEKAREGQPLHSHLSKQQAGLPRFPRRARGSPGAGVKRWEPPPSPAGMGPRCSSALGQVAPCLQPGFVLCVLKEGVSGIVFPFKLGSFFPFLSLFSGGFLFFFPFEIYFSPFGNSISWCSYDCQVSHQNPHALPSPFFICGLLRASLWQLWWDSGT